MNERVTPRAGPLFRRAAALPLEGAKRRRLLALIAAFADAGEHSPPMNDLARRLGLSAKTIDALLDRLEADGWIRVEWARSGRPPGRRSAKGRRNVYALGSWANDEPPTEARDRTAAGSTR